MPLFNTENEAKEYYIENINKHTSYLCPLLKSNCDCMCVCFNEKAPYQEASGKWRTLAEGCENQMLIGPDES